MKLGDILALQRGTTYKGSLLGHAGPVLLGLASIKPNGGFRDDSLKTYGGESPEKLILRPGDLYVSLKDVTQSADLLGAVARVPEKILEGRLTQDTVKLIFKDGTIPQAYIYWLLRAPEYREYCRMRATGTTNLGLSRDDFFEFPIPDPTKYRLELIDMLEYVEKKIELDRRINTTLEIMARSLFRQWFVDSQEVGNWGIGAVFDDFDLTMGQSPPGETYNENGEGIPFFQGRTDFEIRFPSNRVYCTAPTRFANPGDTLVCVRAPVGDLNMASEKCAIGRGVAAIRHKTGSRSYTYYTMQSLEENFKQFEGEGTVFGSINKTDFQNLKVAIPPSATVEKFEEICYPIDQMIENNEKESRTLGSLRDSLLPKLMRGEVRVKDES